MTTELYEFWKRPEIKQRARNTILYTLNNEQVVPTYREIIRITENAFGGRRVTGPTFLSYMAELKEAGLVAIDTSPEYPHNPSYSLTEEGKRLALSLDPKNL